MDSSAVGQCNGGATTRPQESLRKSARCASAWTPNRRSRRTGALHGLWRARAPWPVSARHPDAELLRRCPRCHLRGLLAPVLLQRWALLRCRVVLQHMLVQVRSLARIHLKGSIRQQHMSKWLVGKRLVILARLQQRRAVGRTTLGEPQAVVLGAGLATARGGQRRPVLEQVTLGCQARLRRRAGFGGTPWSRRWVPPASPSWSGRSGTPVARPGSARDDIRPVSGSL